MTKDIEIIYLCTALMMTMIGISIIIKVALIRKINKLIDIMDKYVKKVKT